MEKQQTKEFSKRVQILSITPNDKYNLEGVKGSLIIDTVEVGKSMLITFEDGMFLRTSEVKKINKTDSQVEVKTRNSVYTLKYI